MTSKIGRESKVMFVVFITGLILMSVVGLAVSASENSPEVLTEESEDRDDLLESETHSTTVVVFYTSTCEYCDNVRQEVEFMTKQNENVTYKSYNLDDGYRDLYRESINSYTYGVPAVQVGDNTWFGYTDTMMDEVENQIEKCDEVGCGIPKVYDR